MSKKNKNSLSISKDPNYQMMQTIAYDKQTFDDIKALTSSQTKDQLKVFLVSQAKTELRRVLKLTMWLDKVEDNYMKKVEDAIDSDYLSLKEYENVINTIATLLMRSNDIISRVLNDDSLMTILNTTVYTDNTVTRNTIVAQLNDPHSRERVRNILNQIIIKADNYIEEDNSADYVEIDPNSEGDKEPDEE